MEPLPARGDVISSDNIEGLEATISIAFNPEWHIFVAIIDGVHNARAFIKIEAEKLVYSIIRPLPVVRRGQVLGSGVPPFR